MKYLFDIVGVAPILYFFEQQQERSSQIHPVQVEYVLSNRCTLDAVLTSIEQIPRNHDWILDEVVDSVVQFWMNNLEVIQHWKTRLEDGGKEQVLISRVGDLSSLRNELNFLFHQ
ncbi:hypothetical protein ACN4EG_09805 [Alkalinema pantanalense CENA528]|uniref:hypothetical protein n=1 Tax=Alkalinema pantanalense TaxID=1620705 RepID=UPI003D6F20BC